MFRRSSGPGQRLRRHGHDDRDDERRANRRRVHRRIRQRIRRSRGFWRGGQHGRSDQRLGFLFEQHRRQIVGRRRPGPGWSRRRWLARWVRKRRLVGMPAGVLRQQHVRRSLRRAAARLRLLSLPTWNDQRLFVWRRRRIRRHGRRIRRRDIVRSAEGPVPIPPAELPDRTSAIDRRHVLGILRADSDVHLHRSGGLPRSQSVHLPYVAWRL